MIEGLTRRRRVVGLLSLTLVASIHAGDAGPADPLSKQSLQLFETVEPGARVRAINPFGNIYTRFGGYENKVELLATIQRLDDGLPELDVRMSRVGSGVEVAVTAPAGGAPSAKRRDRVDLVLFIPRGVAIEVETVGDLIEVKGLKGSDVQAISLKGDIRISSIEGRVRARSARGTIQVTLSSSVTQESQDLTTETGDIEVYLWEDANTSVELATSGEISTDFSLQIEHLRFEEPGKRATAVVGQGGPKLALSSKRGRVRLLRLQKDFVPEN